MNINKAYAIDNHVTEDVNETADTTEDREAGLNVDHVTENVNETTDTTMNAEEELNVDDFLKTIGEFGIAQKLIVIILSLMALQAGYQTSIIVFIGDEPPWTCVSDNRTTFLCDKNGTFSNSHSFYESRCSMSRLSWTFTKPQTYSVVTQVSSYFILLSAETHYPFYLF